MLEGRDTLPALWGRVVRGPVCAVALSVSLGACVPLTTTQSPPVAPTAPSAPAPEPAAPATEIETRAPRSGAIAAHFQRIEEQRLADGLLRTDPRPADLPFAARDLEEVFVRVALHDEYTFVGNRLLEQETPAPCGAGGCLLECVWNSGTRSPPRCAARIRALSAGLLPVLRH